MHGGYFAKLNETKVQVCILFGCVGQVHMEHIWLR